MATKSQIAANQQNAQSSTGPRTEDGKAASSQNARTFGLYTASDYVRPEEEDFYEYFRETMRAELNPEGLLEDILVTEITGASWRLFNCSEAEAKLGEFSEATDKLRRSIERARAHAHSCLHRATNQLKKLQKERASEEKKAQHQAFEAMVTAALTLPQRPKSASNCNEGRSAKAEPLTDPKIAPSPIKPGLKSTPPEPLTAAA